MTFWIQRDLDGLKMVLHEMLVQLQKALITVLTQTHFVISEFQYRLPGQSGIWLQQGVLSRWVQKNGYVSESESFYISRLLQYKWKPVYFELSEREREACTAKCRKKGRSRPAEETETRVWEGSQKRCSFKIIFHRTDDGQSPKRNTAVIKKHLYPLASVEY